MKTRTIPGFYAEASIFSVANNYQAHWAAPGGGNATVVAALAATGTFECAGTCPDGAILCRGTKNCQCCKTGCAVDKDGYAFCTHDPITLTGGRGGAFRAGTGSFAFR